jgi:hypothetical protein
MFLSSFCFFLRLKTMSGHPFFPAAIKALRDQRSDSEVSIADAFCCFGNLIVT